MIDQINFQNYWDNGKNPLSTNRAKKSLKSMITFFSNRDNLIQILEDLEIDAKNYQFSPSTFNLIEERIHRCINNWIITNNDELLLEIFHLIQLWGGITGRNIYNMGNKFEKNFSIDEYKKLINLVKQKDQIGIVNFIKNNKFKQINISFLTKHTQFWSIVLHNEYECYPILDNIISKKLFEKNANVRYYNAYIEILDRISIENKISRLNASKIIFDYFERLSS